MREFAATFNVLRGRVLLPLVLGALLVAALTAPAAFADASEIVNENALPGSPASEWDVTGAGDPFLQGYAVDMSVDQGQTARFKIDSTALADYRLDIYRLGWYGGLGARKVATVQPSVSLPQVQPPCLTDAATGLVDCGNWAESASWAVPADAVSGVYLARLVREPEDGSASHVAFVVRDDDGASDLVVQTDDTTWQAYNRYGGNSLYSGSPAGRAYKVSYNRPITTRAYVPEDWVFNAVYPLVRWAERNGYDVSYITGVDTDRAGAELLEHKTFISVGHDEYWSNTQRLNVEAARGAGVNLAFMSGNEVFWKTRWESSIDGTATSHRTLVSYKETHAGAKIDPEPNVWTGTWRDKRFSPPADGGRPENALTGTIFTVNGRRDDAIQVPADDGKLRLWRNTSVAALAPGQVATFPNGTLGYEWDEDLDNGHRPPGLVRMSTTTVNGVPHLQDNGSTYASGTATHHLTLYRHTSGALVFGGGTVQWSWGLDEQHDFAGPPAEPRMQQATVNLFADMGVQPSTLQAGLTAATASTDTTAPSSTIVAPLGGATVSQGAPVAISGTAVDTGGGVVGAVEVSTDNGATWHPANGREAWTYAWQPAAQGNHTIRVRAADDSANLEAAGAGITVTVGPSAPVVCPCTIFSVLDTPGVQQSDNGAVELGVKFRSDQAGHITGVRFYKHAGNLGTHTGHLWTVGGQLLATAVFTAETATGWQEAVFPAPVAIAANTTYVVSYHAPQGNYAASGNYFDNEKLNPPLRALQTGADGGNGVYQYGPSGGFPVNTFNAANYWVDAVFATDVGPDTTDPVVSAIAPANGASGVAAGANVVVSFSEPMDAATINGATVQLRNAANTLVPATVTYNAAARQATLDPTAALANSAQYTLTVQSGASGVKDVAGNALAIGRVSAFTTAAPPPPPPNEGPGGPILVVGSATNPFGRYPAEILRAEGLNEFTVTDISLVNPALLTSFDVVILGDMGLSAGQVTTLTNWVNGGGNLIALRPDPQLAGLLGLAPAGGTLSDAYLKVDTASSPGAGIVEETIQFHSAADRYALNGAAAIATLYSNATQATANPAVTLRAVGSNGGQAAAFTYDLARSIVYTRQGNPAWAGQERDGTAPIRSDDMFFPDWIDLNKVQIPQADEQQRLLVNLITEMNRDKKPLPRFWYFPRDEKAVVLMTGDDHGNGGTTGRFAIEQGQSPAGCNVADWECVRSSSYIYPGTSISDAQAVAFEAQGFEVGTHVNTGCGDFTPASLAADYAAQTGAVAAQLPSVPRAVSTRNHCIVFSDWSTQPKTALQNGIRLDTNYYYWPPGWVNDRPGHFTGSGMLMRFADLDGSMIDVYQAATQMTDESGQSYPLHPDVLLDNAVGAKGYYGVMTANMHTDGASHASQQAIVASAQARSVPVVSGRQMLEWLDGRNGSSFQNLSWAGDALSFGIAVGAGANGLRAMVPTQSAVGPLGELTRGGATVPTITRTIKGVEYAFFNAAAGSYVASYAADTTAPTITGVAADAADDGTAAISWTTNEPATSRVEYGLSAAALNLSATEAGLATDHVVSLSGLAPNVTYHYRVVSTDGAGNPAISPTASFVMPSVSLVDTTDAHFLAGSGDCPVAGGGVRLAPSVSEQFSGSTLPAGWTPFSWTGSGAVTVAGGAVTADGQRVTSDAVYGPGRVLELRGTLAAAPFQHFGFAGGDPFNGSPWAIFSTGVSGSSLLARTWGSGAMVDTPIAGVALGQPHDFRIEWNAAGVVYYVDGVQVASHAEAISADMRIGMSDFNAGGGAVSLDSVSLTPYSSPCTFESRIHDAGAVAGWNTLTATTDLPAGTSIVLAARTGNTATPDATWGAWVPVSGTTLGLNGRYLQYRAVLAATDPARTPELREVQLGLSTGPDTTAPAILERTPAPGATGVARDANVTVRFDEPLRQTSVTAATARLRAVGAGADVTAVVAYADSVVTIDSDSALDPNRVYRVTFDGVTDLAGNTLAAADTWTFRTEKLTATLIDTTDADFAAGTTGCLVSGGRVTLAPALAETFDGPALPASWSSASWTGGGGTVGGGLLTVDGGRAFTNVVFGPGSAVEYVATFGTQAFQHVGFGTGDEAGGPETFNGPTWAMFSNGFGGGIQARTWGGSQINTDIPGNFLGSPHVFRIDWTPTAIEYRIDGILVATHLEAIAGPMRVAASDFNNGGGAVTVDSLSMTPYATPCTFTSRVLDAGGAATWQSLTHTADTPAGTSVGLSVRAGNTAAPDASWTAFELVPDGGALSLAGRYLQYSAALATAAPPLTPALLDVTATALVESNEAPAAADDAYTVAEDGTLTVPAPGVLANDGDGNGDALAAALVSDPAHGTLSLNADGSFTYTPATNFHGPDSFTYGAGDGASSGPATVTIAVTPVNDGPTAAADAATTAEDTAVVVNVLANDADLDGDTLTASSPSGASHGSLAVVAGGIRYTPAANFHGADSFTYVVEDGKGGSATATVSVTVTSVNDNPTAANDVAQTTAGAPVTVSVLANDSAAPDTGESLSVTATTAPANGTVAIVEGGTAVRYTPNAGFAGTNAFTYTVSDGNGGTATATVTITVVPVAGVPVLNVGTGAIAVQYGDAVALTVSATDSNTPLTTLRFTATGLPGGVTFTDNRNGTARFGGKANVAAGVYTVTVRVTDGTNAVTKPVAITVSKESATLAWNENYWADAGSDNTATATLRARVTQVSDGSNGDVTQSRVEFRLFRSSNVSGTPDLVVGPVQPASDGNAQITRLLEIDTWTVVARLVKTNGFYTGPDAQPIVYTIAIPQYPQSVVASGYVTDPSYLNLPVAVHASFRRGHLGIAATRAVSFAVITYAFRGSDGLDYIVKGSGATWSSSIAFQSSTRASLADGCTVIVLDPATGAVVPAKGGTGFSCRIDATDTDNIGRYALTVNAPGGALWHRVGTVTAQLQVTGGTLQIRR